MLRSLFLLLLVQPSVSSGLPRVGAAPALVQRIGRLASGRSQTLLTKCPTPGCGTLLKPGRVAAHLQRCPALTQVRELEASGYWCRDANIGASDLLSDERGLSPVTLANASAAELAHLHARIYEAHHASRGSQLAHSSPTAVAPTAAIGGRSKHELARERHRSQRRAIASEVASLGVLGQGYCIIELGAGNGALFLTA